MGDRLWRGHLFKDWEAETVAGTVSAGLFTLQMEVAGGYSVGPAPDDAPGVESWAPEIRAVMGRW